MNDRLIKAMECNVNILDKFKLDRKKPYTFLLSGHLGIFTLFALHELSQPAEDVCASDLLTLLKDNVVR
jgi:hypothetical protein